MSTAEAEKDDDHHELLAWADGIDEIESVDTDYTTQARLVINDDLITHDWADLADLGYYVNGIRHGGAWVYVSETGGRR